MVLILEFAWILPQKDPADPQQNLQTNTDEFQNQTVQSSTQGTIEPTGILDDATGETPAATETVPTELPATELPTTEPVQTEPEVTAPNETEPKETKPKNPTSSNKPGGSEKPTEKPDNSYKFPYTIPGSTLVIEQINSYDGIFLEDGSDKEVTNITAMVLTNTGDICVEYAHITLERDGTQLQFTVSVLEAGASVVVMESGATQFSKGKYTNCTADIATMTAMVMSEDQIYVKENADGSLQVTNISTVDIPCVRVFYKFYMSDANAYVGGITYTAKIVDLTAGSSCVITPSHYLQGYSKIVMIKTYDSDD